MTKEKVFFGLLCLVFAFGAVFVASAATNDNESTNELLTNEEEKTKTEASAMFADAKVMEAEKDIAGTSLKEGEAMYYELEVLPGEQLRIMGSAEMATEGAEYKFTLYLSDEELLSSNAVLGYADASKAESNVIYYLPGVAEDVFKVKDQTTVYLEVMAEKGDLGNYSLIATITDKSDLGSGTDAGDSIAESITLDTGDYIGNFMAWSECGVNQYCSTDQADVYEIEVSEDETLTFSMSTKESYNLSAMVLDADEDELASTKKGGKTIELEYLADEDGYLYLVVMAKTDKPYFYGAYDLAMESDNPNRGKATNANAKNENAENENAENENGDANENLAPIVNAIETDLNTYVKEEIEAAEEISLVDSLMNTLKKYLIFIIVGVVILIGLIVVIVVLMMRKKKGPPASPAGGPAPPAEPIGGAGALPQPGTGMPSQPGTPTSIQPPRSVAGPSAAPGPRPAPMDTRPGGTPPGPRPTPMQ